MTKTPEELTEEWLNNKLQAGSFWFVKTEDSNPEPMVVDMDGDFNDYEGNYYRPCFSKGKLKVLAPIPTYNEYKAMQAELDEFRRAVTSYVDKPIDYDIACEIVNKLLDDKEQLKKELKSARWYQTVLNEDIGKLRGLLRECLPIVSAEIMTWQIRGGEESHKRGQDLLTRINAALGESEEK